MSRPPIPITLSPSLRDELIALTKLPKIQRRYADRARIILKAADGYSNLKIASELNIRSATVSKWRNRFAQDGVEGLHDDYRPGRPPQEDSPEQLREKILLQLDKDPPSGYAKWNGRLLGEALGVKPDLIWRETRRMGLNMERRHSWCISTDPEFEAKSTDIIGLYLGPPANAVVLSIDEKPCIQALERRQGWLKMPNGKAITGFSHEYKRHGTTNLFSALNVATGQVIGNCFPRKRRDEFIVFLNRLLANYPDQQIHLILDNLSIHKMKEDHQWRLKHPRVHFHFTPTHASWMNQIEAWFSILSRSALKGASFMDIKSLIKAIEDFIAVYNETAMPFEWTKIRVKPKTPESKYANLIK